MTRQKQEFDYYCLDRCKPIFDEIVVVYNDGSVIRKVLYKIGLRANIKHVDCLLLYTASDADLEKLVYIATDTFYDNQRRFFTDVLSNEEMKNLFKQLITINIFEYTSLLDFNYIYDEFKELVEYNWDALNMDNLIEI